MKLYRFSPITSHAQLLDAIAHIHASCYALCEASFGMMLPNAGNMGVFCHYPDEYRFLTALREKLTEASEDLNLKYFRLHQPIVIPALGALPETVYTHLYIRQPDPYRHHVGDVDFYVAPDAYALLKTRLQRGEVIPGARIFPREDLDMIELFDPDVDALGYVSMKRMTEKVRVKTKA